KRRKTLLAQLGRLNFEYLRGELKRFWSLHRDLSKSIGHVHYVRADCVLLLDPSNVFRGRSGVDAEEVVFTIETINNNVVDDSALRIEEQRILRLARGELCHVVGGEMLQERERFRPANGHLTHMAHVKEAAVLSHRHVLFDHSRVLHRHLPAAERDKARAE